MTTDNKGSSRVRIFSRVLPVLFTVAILFQLVLAKERLTSLEAARETLLDALVPSLGVSLIAAGVLALVSGRNGEDTKR
jgi:hypothetical protein